MTDAFLGEWKLISSENVDEILKALGVGLVLRKIAANVKPNMILERNGDEWILKGVSSVKTKITKFKMGEEFEDETMDGRKVRATFTIENGKIVQYQKDKNGKLVCVTTREVTPDGKLKVVSIFCRH